MKRLTASIALAVLAALSVPARAQEIVIGNLADITGGTGDVGKPYADGVKAYTDHINASGGINGKKIKLLQQDYAYKIPEALALYKKFKDQDKVLAIQGWGSGDTEALKEQVAKDQIPYWSASYSAHLTDPAKSPYNFFCAVDYSTALRGALKYLKDNWKESRKPKVAFIYPDVGYGKAPIPAGKKYAEELGFEIVGEENVDLKALEATTQLLNIKKKDPDFAWIGGTKVSTSVILKDAKKLGLRTKFFGNIWSADEGMPKLAGGAEEGYMIIIGAALYGENVPGMAAIKKATNNQPVVSHWIRGWVSMMTMCEVLKAADKAKELNGPGIRKHAEQLKNFNTQGLTAPITYTSTDHRPFMSVIVAEFKGGQMVKKATVELPRKQEWIGF
ncbi:MAG: ABC transporter substrate-binding protein [Acidobacteria bacterium]|nr:ABC transporter substrate-binding protein [Acidobacteriota bacterium]